VISKIVMLRLTRGAISSSHKFQPIRITPVFSGQFNRSISRKVSRKQQQEELNPLKVNKRVSEARPFGEYAPDQPGESTEWSLDSPENVFIGDFIQPKYDQLYKDQDPKDYLTYTYCAICLDGHILDPMNTQFLKDYMNIDGTMLPRRGGTNFCRRHQKQFARTVKRAVNMGIFTWKKGFFRSAKFFDKAAWTSFNGEQTSLNQQELTTLFQSRVIKNPESDVVPSLEGSFAHNWDMSDINLQAFAKSIQDVAREIASAPRTRIYIDEDGKPVSLDPTPIPVKEITQEMQDQAEDESEGDLIMEGGVDMDEELADLESNGFMDLLSRNHDKGSAISWEKNEDGTIKMTPRLEEPPNGQKLETFDREAFREQLKLDISNLLKERYVPSGMKEADAQKVEAVLFKIVDKEFDHVRDTPQDYRLKAMEYSVFPPEEDEADRAQQRLLARNSSSFDAFGI